MKNFCGDCGCKEGELHNFFPGCDQEICPKCRLEKIEVIKDGDKN